MFAVKGWRISCVFERVIEARQVISPPRPEAPFRVGCATFISAAGVFVSNFVFLKN